MSLRLDIPESMIEPTKKVYRNSAKEVWDRYYSAKKEWEEIKPILSQLGILNEFENEYVQSPPIKTSLSPAVKMNDLFYNKDFSWFKKAVFAINQNGPMSSLEMIDYLKKFWENDLNITVARNSLPATLSVAAKDNKIARTKRSNGEYVYELIEN